MRAIKESHMLQPKGRKRMGYAHAVQADLFDPHPRESDKEESAFGTINVKEARLTPTPVFDAYWRFAAERQEIFFRRHRRYNSPRLTDDPVLAEFKFTNAYRASDRVSQYLIREVIYNDAYSNDPSEVFFRIILFKIFNKTGHLLIMFTTSVTIAQSLYT